MPGHPHFLQSLSLNLFPTSYDFISSYLFPNVSQCFSILPYDYFRSSAISHSLPLIFLCLLFPPLHVFIHVFFFFYSLFHSFIFCPLYTYAYFNLVPLSIFLSILLLPVTDVIYTGSVAHTSSNTRG
jgi:hypothetical protein